MVRMDYTEFRCNLAFLRAALHFQFVIPAKTGIQFLTRQEQLALQRRLNQIKD